MTFGDPTMTTIEWHKISLHFECGNTKGVHYICPVLSHGDLITVESNLIWLIYFPRESFFDSLSSMNTTFRDLDHITMKTSLEFGETFHVELMKCGYRCVFKQDLQKFNSTMKHHKNLFARKRKFLAIED